MNRFKQGDFVFLRLVNEYGHVADRYVTWDACLVKMIADGCVRCAGNAHTARATMTMAGPIAVEELEFNGFIEAK